MNAPRLPDFLIIGAPKCGTTSLYHYLEQHPQVWMPPLKEPHWFLFDGPNPPRLGGPGDTVRRREMVRRWTDYQALFARCPPHRVCGEVSVRYLYSQQACQAIHRRLPGVRLIAILRQPVDRAYSTYRRDRLQGSESCASFAAAMADGPRREREGWLRGVQPAMGFYARALAPWLKTFDPAQMRIYLYDDLVADPVALIRDLYRFIGVDADFLPDLKQRFNVTGIIGNPLWRALWLGTRGLRSRLMPLVPLALRGRFFGSPAVSLRPVRPVPGEPLDPLLHARLTDDYRHDILALGRMLNRDLSTWLEPASVAREPTRR